MLSHMKFRKIAVLTLLVFSSLGASNVAPSKSELESMYDKAFRAFDANNFPDALKELDAIDTRQPDLAESQNLRGVIFMRQRIYDKAEAALYRAVELDPKFWNARFNLAEIPFLQKNWTEARNRFQALLSSNSAELQGDATQLIQYKILLTYVLEGKENMVDSLLSKFELSANTPAVQYSNAAIAFQHKDDKGAKASIAAAEKNFSPQLNKLFAESLYEIGWMKKPAGQGRAALELTSEEERAARAKSYAKDKLDQSEEAFQKRDLAGALKLLDEADAADPNQPTHLNLRGEILMEQKDYDKAETLFKQALKIEPKFREAQYNLAQIPFKKKEYGKARDRLEALFAATPGGDKNQAAQLIKFKIFMTLLLEDKDSRAQKMMEQFQFTGDTPALYYAQAAWEFKHNNPTKGNDWISSARKIYSLPLNIVFSDPFYDVGWLQNQAPTEQPASSQPMVAQGEPAAPAGANPLIEPSPIPGATTAENQASTEPALTLAPSISPTISGMEATTSAGSIAAAASSPAEATVVQNKPPAPAPSASISIAASAPAVSKAPPEVLVKKAQPEISAVKQPVVTSASAAASIASTPATVLAPARVKEWSQPTIGETFYRLSDWHTLLVIGLLIAGLALLAWVIVPELRRRFAGAVYAGVSPVTEPSFDDGNDLRDHEEVASTRRFSGGPPRRSVQLKATEPSVRRAVIPVGKPGRGSTADVGHGVEHFHAPAPEFTSPNETVPEELAAASAEPEASDVGEPMEVVAETEYAGAEIASSTEQTIESSATIPLESETAMRDKSFAEPEPIAQGQPVPYQTPPAAPPPSIRPPKESPIPEPVRPLADIPSFVPRTVSTEPSIQPSTQPAIMPEPTPTPVIRTAPATGAPSPVAGGMQTAVQITFSCEIAALQLTPAFKMGALQLKPTSKIVMMRLSPSQQPQPAMNLQVTFEVATVQLAGNSLGTIRLTPSQQQKPGVNTSPAFNIAGVQLVSGSESAPVQLTPSQQGGKASVHMTAAFNIATVEFSPSFEIASIVLNCTSKSVSVQLPGAGPSAIEGAPVFEIANVQVGGSGEIGLIQLGPPGAPQRRA